jgi:hypothetical protein
MDACHDQLQEAVHSGHLLPRIFWSESTVRIAVVLAPHHLPCGAARLSDARGRKWYRLLYRLLAAVQSARKPTCAHTPTPTH